MQNINSYLKDMMLNITYQETEPEPERLIITKDNRSETNWIDGISYGRRFEAKLFDEGTNGLGNQFRIAKLAIYKKSYRIHSDPWHPQLDMHYDRGLDFNHMWKSNRKLYNKIVEAIESIPPLE